MWRSSSQVLRSIKSCSNLKHLGADIRSDTRWDQCWMKSMDDSFTLIKHVPTSDVSLKRRDWFDLFGRVWQGITSARGCYFMAVSRVPGGWEINTQAKLNWGIWDWKPVNRFDERLIHFFSAHMWLCRVTCATSLSLWERQIDPSWEDRGLLSPSVGLKKKKEIDLLDICIHVWTPRAPAV